MKKTAVLILVLCLALSGCTNWVDGSYSSVKPHKEPVNYGEQKPVPVYKYEELAALLASFVESGTESGTVSLQYGSDEDYEADLEKAVREIRQGNPFAIYAVDNISCNFETDLGSNTVSIRISYRSDCVRADKILWVKSQEDVHRAIAQQLDECGGEVVLYFDAAQQLNYARLVEEYGMANPQTVMEIPAVTEVYYPEDGDRQIVALEFTYQTSYAELRSMQNKVAPVFSSAQQYVAGNWSEAEKALWLYTFLMNRYEYAIQTSITPAYSLLLSGEGDCKAFAMVYGAMCKQAGIDCRVVTGTREGKAWVWNAIKLEGQVYYLDILQCSRSGVFALYEENQMKDYRWDKSEYRT